MNQNNVPTLFAHWEAFVDWLLDRTEQFPKRLRFTITTRIDNRAMDIFEHLVEARYAKEKLVLLNTINRDLEALRLLMRLAHTRRAMDHRSFEYAIEQVDIAGRMVGGWLRQQRAHGRKK